MAKERIGFLGAGQMAEAIARGIVSAKMAEPSMLIASDPDAARRDLFREMGARAGEDNLAVVKEADTLIIAVKPQTLAELLTQIGSVLREKQRIISICAGVPTTVIEAASKRKLRVVRAMPNLPMRVRMGATALCPGKHATAQDMALAGKIFSAGGRAVEVKEELMDAVTALSGSGPAYFYFLVEVMIEAGVQEGAEPDRRAHPGDPDRPRRRRNDGRRRRLPRGTAPPRHQQSRHHRGGVQKDRRTQSARGAQSRHRRRCGKSEGVGKAVGVQNARGARKRSRECRVHNGGAQRTEWWSALSQRAGRGR